jgi:N-acetylneuraminate synthase
MEEIDTAVEHIRSRGIEPAVLQCTTDYPCPPEKVGLNLVTEFRERYGCPVGISDHSGTVFPGLAAATLCIELLEVHVTFSREMFGPDVPASITTDELTQLTKGIRFIETMTAHPVNKEDMARDLKPLRDMFTKSVVAQKNLKAGKVLEKEDLTLKKPGTGLPAARLPELIGRQLKRAVAADTMISEEDLA